MNDNLAAHNRYRITRAWWSGTLYTQCFVTNTNSLLYEELSWFCSFLKLKLTDGMVFINVCTAYDLNGILGEKICRDCMMKIIFEQRVL